MTVAFDAFTESAINTGNHSFTHTPVGTPRGVIVFVISNFQSDEITGVTYGGTTMTEVTGSPNVLVGGEGGAAHCFFLGSSVPAGAQTVAVTVTNAVNGVGVITLTAGGNTEVIDSDGAINSTSQENPSVTLSLGGRTCFCAIAFRSGQNDPAGITPLANWTSRAEVDFGTQTGGYYTYDTIGSTDVTAGWTQLADDAVAMAIAVSEVQGAATTASNRMMMGMG